MTNISQELEVLLAKYFKKYQPYDGEAEQTIEAIKQTLLTYIKELCEFEKLATVNPKTQIRNQLRQEILSKAEEELGL